MKFDDAFSKLIGNEGGYVNDPADPGGETKFGISKRAYPNLDIAALTLDQAKAIYLRDYWQPAGCEVVPDLLKFDLFDTAVNTSAPGDCRTAIKMLQHAVDQVEDGVFGVHTLQALNSQDPIRLLFRFDAARLVYYSQIHNEQVWDKFGRGLIRRVAANMLSI